MNFFKNIIAGGVIVFCFLSKTASAQVQNFYWVQFDSKSSNLFLPESSFLSPKAIERRQKQDIEISENDYPVYAPYKQAVAQIADSVVHTLKWFNAITIILNDNSKLPQIRNLSFVKNIQQLDVIPTALKKESDKLKLELSALEKSNAENEYGFSFNQTEMLHLDRLHQLGFKGKNILIAVLDNGFMNVDTISAFRHLFSENSVLYTYDYARRINDVYSDGTHGTSVLSCIAAKKEGDFLGTATEADFALFITEDNRSESILEEFNWAEAAEKADSLGADIFSTSLGYNYFDNSFANHDYFDLTGDKAVMTQASNIAFSKGILVITSAGNEGEKPWKFITVPADGKDVLTIGAVKKDGTLANFSSRGPNALGVIKPDVCAQGSEVAVLNTNGKVVGSSGTSFACPITAGAAACLWQALPDFSAAAIKQLIIESAHLFETPNNDYGYGIPNFYKAWLKNSNKKDLLNSEKQTVIFPNPFDAFCTLFLKSEKDGEAKISVADMSGKILFKTSMQVFSHDVQLVDVRETELLSAGNYFLTIELNGKKMTHRIVKIDL